VQQKVEVIMPEAVKPKYPAPAVPESSFLSLLSGWVQQGVENFFATQRILVDLAVRQNAAAMRIVRDRLSDPAFCPMSILTELAGEGMSNFIEGQKLLLELAHKENEIVINGVKDRIGGSPAAAAVADLLRRSVNTFIEMNQDFLKIASRQTHDWLAAVEKGKRYDGEHLVEAAREGMDTFVRVQKKFLDVVAEEVSKATKGAPEVVKKGKKVELAELARQATETFIEAQKKLMDVAGKQVNANLRATGRAMNMIKPFPFIPLPDLTREGVRSFVDAEKALIDTMMPRRKAAKPAAKVVRRKKRAVRPRAVVVPSGA